MKKSNLQATIQGATTQQAPLQGEERKEFFEERKLFIDLQHQASQSFDKTIVTLAGGALALSLTFIRQTVPEAMPGTTVFLACAWILLILSLLSTLLSLFTSQLGMIKAIEELYSNFVGSNQVKQIHSHFIRRAYVKVGEKLSNLFGHRLATHLLNIAAIIFFITGMGFLVWFVMLNIPLLQVPLQK